MPPEDKLGWHGQHVDHAVRRVARHLPRAALVDAEARQAATTSVEAHLHEHLTGDEVKEQPAAGSVLPRQALARRDEKQAQLVA